MRTYGLVIVGDEILRGKRPDKHLAKFIEMLGARDLHLSWVQYLGDERTRLIDVFRHTLASGDVVFSCGGIGVTPDDHTRQAAAAAAGVSLELNPEAEREIDRRKLGFAPPAVCFRGKHAGFQGKFRGGPDVVIPHAERRQAGALDLNRRRRRDGPLRMADRARGNIIPGAGSKGDQEQGGDESHRWCQRMGTP